MKKLIANGCEELRDRGGGLFRSHRSCPNMCLVFFPPFSYLSLTRSHYVVHAFIS